MIGVQDIVLYQGIILDNVLMQQVQIIAKHTQNTWQTSRTLEQIISDTMIGKVAESIVKNHIGQYSDYAVWDYDDFRINNYKKHAPLDCILFKKGNPLIQQAIMQINSDATNSPNGALSKETKKFLKSSQIFTLEIKSTRITDRHKDAALSVSVEAILKDDFLAYPKFFRKVPSDIRLSSWEDYLQLCLQSNKLQSSTDFASLKAKELENMYDYYVRAYVEQKENNLFDVYVVGYIAKTNFIHNSIIKRMPQYNKSEQALYIATNLKNGASLRPLIVIC